MPASHRPARLSVRKAIRKPMTAPETPASVAATPAILPCHSAHLANSKPNAHIATSSTIKDAATDAPDAYPSAFKTRGDLLIACPFHSNFGREPKVCLSDSWHLCDLYWHGSGFLILKGRLPTGRWGDIQLSLTAFRLSDPSSSSSIRIEGNKTSVPLSRGRR